MKIKVLYEDSNILAIDKPSGILVHPAEGSKGKTILDLFLKKYPKLEIVHRLDKDTSGLLLVAKTAAALENLQQQFAGREVKKEYLALVHGEIKEPGVVEGGIGRNPGNREKFTVLESGGKEAVTEYNPISNFKFQISNQAQIFNELNKIQMRKLERLYSGGFTLVRCFPKTGRTHQIRVHLKYIGFPIVADEKYVGRKMYRLDKRFCPRQFLHAAKISFIHPERGERLEFESSLPEDLEKALWIAFSYNWQ